MPNNLTDVAEDLVLNWLNPAVAAPTRPTSPLRVALFTTLPNQETGTGGVEVAGGAYARTSVTLSASSGGQQSNSADVTFPTATANWGTVLGIGVYDSAGSPVLIWVGPLAASKVVDNGDTFKIPASQLTMSIN